MNTSINGVITVDELTDRFVISSLTPKHSKDGVYGRSYFAESK